MIQVNEQDAALIHQGRKVQIRQPIHPQPEFVANEDLFGGGSGELVLWAPAGTTAITPSALAALCPYARAGEPLTVQVRLPYQKQVELALRCKSVRIERLEAISDQDLEAEGGMNWTVFASTWGDLHGRTGYPVVSNPYVWVIEFTLA